jgi:hypothetical protein
MRELSVTEQRYQAVLAVIVERAVARGVFPPGSDHRLVFEL